MKRLILCADDYALSPGVDKGIRTLVTAKRLSAVSCITNSPYWPEAAEKLKLLSADIQVGLHVNLTTTFETPATPLWRIIGDCVLGLLDKKQSSWEFNRQLELFEYFWGKKPDFVDGHQHVHIFPTIRTIIIRALSERYSDGNRPWLRQINPSLTGHDALLKALLLRVLGVGFSRAARQANLQLSGNFYGLYSLSSSANFPAMLTSWMQAASDQSLIMCHPAMKESKLAEKDIDQARISEFQYLISESFISYVDNKTISF